MLPPLLLFVANGSVCDFAFPPHRKTFIPTQTSATKRQTNAPLPEQFTLRQSLQVLRFPVPIQVLEVLAEARRLGSLME